MPEVKHNKSVCCNCQWQEKEDEITHVFLDGEHMGLVKFAEEGEDGTVLRLRYNPETLIALYELRRGHVEFKHAEKE